MNEHLAKVPPSDRKLRDEGLELDRLSLPFVEDMNWFGALE